jgi:glycerol-3-phosphate O-acyltransferase
VLTLPFRRRSRRYGNACVAFGTPVSLQDWLRQHDIDIAELEKPGRYSWLPAFADDLMRSCEQEVPALPVAVTALALCEDGLSESWLLLPDGADAAVGFALELLAANNLVRHVGDGNYSIIASELSVLRHYANSIAHLDS